MRRLAVILMVCGLAITGQGADDVQASVTNEPTILSSLGVKPTILSSLGVKMNAAVEFKANVLERLTKHNPRRESWLFQQIQQIRNVAKTDLEKAEQMATALIEKLKALGLDT